MVLNIACVAGIIFFAIKVNSTMNFVPADESEIVKEIKDLKKLKEAKKSVRFWRETQEKQQEAHDKFSDMQIRFYVFLGLVMLVNIIYSLRQKSD